MLPRLQSLNRSFTVTGSRQLPLANKAHATAAMAAAYSQSVDTSSEQIYRVAQKNRTLYTLVHIFAKY